MGDRGDCNCDQALALNEDNKKLAKQVVAALAVMGCIEKRVERFEAESAGLTMAQIAFVEDLKRMCGYG